MIDLIINIIGFSLIFLGLDLYRVEKFNLFSIETLVQILIVCFATIFIDNNFYFLTSKVFFWVIGFILLMIAKDYKRKETEIYPFFSKETLTQIFVILFGTLIAII